MNAKTTLRRPSDGPGAHPELGPVLEASRGRHLTDEELALLRSTLPAHAARAEAARAIREAEPAVVAEVVRQVLSEFAFDEAHEYSPAKCTRDVSSVSAYATLAMVLDDARWLDDRLLLWLRTILHAFCFPARRQRRRTVFGGGGSDEPHEAIRVTYEGLARRMEAAIGPEHWALAGPFYEQVVRELTREDS